MECAFCRIIAGEIAADLVLEDQDCIGFLDNNPLFPGHVLIVPRVHVETLPELPAEAVTPLFSNVRVVAQAVETALSADGSFVAINNRVSQTVPHLHAHVVPRRKRDGLKGFFWPRRNYSGEDHRRETAAALRQEIARLKKLVDAFS